MLQIFLLFFYTNPKLAEPIACVQVSGPGGGGVVRPRRGGRSGTGKRRPRTATPRGRPGLAAEVKGGSQKWTHLKKTGAETPGVFFPSMFTHKLTVKSSSAVLSIDI